MSARTASTVARPLRRGVNLSHWYGQVYFAPGYSPAHYADYLRQDDLELIAALGFDHVRLPLALEQMLGADGDSLETDFVDRVAHEVDRLHRLDLSVTIDLHPEGEFKDALARSDAAVDRFVADWGRIAARFADTDPELTVFEVLNEPGIGDAGRWAGLLERSVAAIRRPAPRHTVIVAGDHYSEVPRLLELPDPPENAIADIHLYDPVALSHQGAHWSPPWLQQTRGLDYPPDAGQVAALRAAADDPQAVAALDDYLAEGWSRERYARFVAPAVDWAAARGVPLLCNEFGLYREFVPRAGRLRWLADVTGVFADAGIGWTVWDYAGDFGVVVGERGARRPDREVIAALGLPDHGPDGFDPRIRA